MSNEPKISGEKCAKTWIDVADDEHECVWVGPHEMHSCRCGANNLDDLPPAPRSWSLPAEPGPEVTRLQDAAGEEWHRVQGGWAPADIRWSQIGVRWSQLLYLVGPLTDATPLAASPLSEEKGASGE